MSIQIRQTSEGYEGEVIVPTQWGPVVVRASAPTAWVDVAIARLTAQRPELMVSGGDFFADVKKTFMDAAKSQVARDVSKTFADAARNPLVQSAVAAYSPQAAAVLKGAGDVAASANQLADKAARGDRRAQQEVAVVTQRAAAGDPKAQTAAKLIRERLRAEQAKRVLAPAAVREQNRANIAARYGVPADSAPAYAAPVYVHPYQVPYGAPPVYAAPPFNPYGAADYQYPHAVPVPLDQYQAAFPAAPAAPAFDWLAPAGVL